MLIINVFMWRSYGFHTAEIGDTHIWVLQFVNLIDPLHEYKHLLDLINIHSLMFHTLVYIEVKFCSYNPSSNFNFYLRNGVLLFQQPLHNHDTRLLQLYKVVNTLH